ncbi:hypothetical protein GOB94_14075 [Granulicella sp. 5B5]|uniref:hypothetical protein n=1 Tax=Granulicella sp. 5B5 TaxID=1617967 RepID=UPI0015F6636A|nr:hypothetical protein [Granulicella sp. 5B5]QMV19693.1 hypothetical protein GOB94_14075 [Granulicella sp. 5B5]
MSIPVIIPTDPTLPTVTVPTSIGDIILCLDFEALAEAEAALIKSGHEDVNLLQSLSMNFPVFRVRMFFAIAARRFQPELNYDEACKLVSLQNIGIIADGILAVWQASTPPVVEGDEAVKNPSVPSDDSAASNAGSGSSPQPEAVSASGGTNFAG